MKGFTKDEMDGQPEHIRRSFTLDNASPREVLGQRIKHAITKFQKHKLDFGSSGVQGRPALTQSP